MKSRFQWHPQGIAAALLITGTLFSTVAYAQGPDGGPPPPGPGPRRGPGRPPRREPRPASVADTPVSALEAGLKLNEDQVTRIIDIQKELRQSRRDLMPNPGERPSQPPDPDTMREKMQANREKMRGLEQNAVRKIEETLTSEQKQALPTFLKEIDSLRVVGIPAEVYGELKLTSDQKKKLTDIARTAQKERRAKQDEERPGGMDARYAREQTHEKAMKVLTKTQRIVVEEFVEAHPRPEPRDGFESPPGGFGPPRGGRPPMGGPEGGPPPMDGQDAPPPPPMDGPDGPDGN